MLRRREIREVVVDVLIVALLLALILVLAGCTSLRELVSTPVEEGGPTVGEAVLEAGAAGVALVNPLAAVGVLAAGRLLLGAIRRK